MIRPVKVLVHRRLSLRANGYRQQPIHGSTPVPPVVPLAVSGSMGPEHALPALPGKAACTSTLTFLLLLRVAP